MLNPFSLYFRHRIPGEEVTEPLKGQTPADLARIKVNGKNKWITIIQNATKETRKD